MRLAPTNHKFNTDPHFHKPIGLDTVPHMRQIELFDQNGYDLTPLEKLYAEANGQAGRWHRPNHYYDWFTDLDDSSTGAHINHELMFER